MVDSLQDMCIYFMKSSEFSANYALAVEPGYIARQICISRADDLPVVFIHTRCTIVDGSFQRGVTCGFHVSRKSFLLGVFEGCVCQDPRTLVQWHTEIRLKGMWFNAYIKHAQKKPENSKFLANRPGFNSVRPLSVSVARSRLYSSLSGDCRLTFLKGNSLLSLICDIYPAIYLRIVFSNYFAFVKMVNDYNLYLSPRVSF